LRTALALDAAFLIGFFSAVALFWPDVYGERYGAT
jgi:hypothetical protein